MIPVIQKPRLNPIQFVPVSLPDDDRYHTRQFLTDWFANEARDYEEKVNYYQKIQTTQRIRLQIHANVLSGCSIDLINRYGRVLKNWSPTIVIQLDGNIEPYTGANYQMYIHYFKFSMSEVAGLQDGRYCLVFKGIFDDTIVKEISEPLEIKGNHRDTILVEYFNDTNDYNVAFENTNCRFAFRIEGDIHDYKPDAEDTDYKNQKQNIIKLYSQPGSTFTLSAGGVPAYMIDILNAAMSCDNIYVEGTRYVKEDGSKWEITSFDEVTLIGASITVREADPERATFTLGSGPLIIYSLPGVYPYAITSIAIGERTASIQIISTIVINNSADETNFVTTLNSKTALLDLFGTFSNTAGKLVYNNAPGEIYSIASSQIFTNYFTLSSKNASVNYPFQFTMQNGLVIIDWGNTFPPIQSYASPAGELVTPSTTYTASPIVYNARVFGNLKLFSISNVQLLSVSNKFPATLSALAISALGTTTGLTSFDTLTLSDCVNSLFSLVVKNSQLSTLSNFGGLPFTKLKNVDFSGNKLSSTAVTGVVISVRNYVAPVNLVGGYITVQGQTPAAPLSATGTLYKNVLVSTYGWTIYND